MEIKRNSPLPRDFYDIQRQQWKKSLPIVGILILFYFVAIGLIVLAALASIGLFVAGPLLPQSFYTKLFLAVFIFASAVAFIHFFDARRSGAEFILRRLSAQPPDVADRYHRQFANTVEEMRIASGLPRVNPYIIPFFAINSMALIEKDGTPAVAVTEGLLADCTRDELQAVSAHELAHISRGDAFFVTMVCSLANVLEKFKTALEPEDVGPEEVGRGERGGAPPVLIYSAVIFTSFIMHLLSTLLSREREILADASAVEISRSPIPLARILYKAHLKSSLVGDFSQIYSPLFIVAPKLSSESENFFSRLFNSHPPLMKRIHLLAQMARLEPAKVIEQVWEIQEKRERARGVLHSFEEIQKSVSYPESKEEIIQPQEQKIWLIRNPRGKWEGPFSLPELILQPFFSSLRRIKNLQEDLEAQAREFPQVRQALRRLGQKKPIDAAKHNRCPRCLVPLGETYYEGVGIKICRRCGGKLVEASLMDRIFFRREFTYSPDLLEKARGFRDRFLLNPVRVQKAREKISRSLYCPDCGYRLVARPYNYQYFIPVDKCLACQKIWFDADELEILQILIEKKV